MHLCKDRVLLKLSTLNFCSVNINNIVKKKVRRGTSIQKEHPETNKTFDKERIFRKTTTEEIIEKPIGGTPPNSPKCSSCLEHETCTESLKDVEICRKYRTNVVLMWNGKQVCFHCSVNMKFSEWLKREDCTPEALENIAAQLDVRPRDVWVLLLKDELPQKKQHTSFPDFDLTEPLESTEKQHIRFKIAEWLLQNYHFLTMQDTGEIYVYDEGVYVPDGEKIIIEAIRKALGEQCSTYDRNETKAIINDATLTDRKVFNHNPDHKICVENGILNLDTMEFTEHSPNEYFQTKIPVKYEPLAECPRIDKFHSEIVDQSDMQTLEELIAYCLYPGYPIHKAVMLIGFGANGKSTWLSMVKAFLGKENCSGLSLQQLGNSRFATSSLVGKFANVYADIPDSSLKNTGTFKMLCGQDLIGAEIKFGKHFNFENHAKLLFSANKIPETSDDTDAFFRRWIIIVFPNKFTDEKNAEYKADHDLIRKLTTPMELSGLLNKCLKRLSQLLDRGHFYGDKTTAEWRIDYIRKSDPITAFYMDCLEEINNPEFYVTKTALYQAFVNYCKNNKLPIVDNSVFSKKIKTNFQWSQESKKQIEGTRVRVWTHLRLTDAEPQNNQQKTLEDT